MAAAKDCHALTSYYVKRYKEKYGSEPNVNRHTARWGFDSVLMSMNSTKAKELVDYYFETPPERRHALDWFFYNYDKLLKAMQDSNTDKEHREHLMEESRKRAEAWRLSGKHRITTD